MKKELTEIERLDLAARAESIEPFLSRAVLPMVFVTVITLLLALGSQASPSETLAVWTFALIGVVTVIMLLLRWCYAAYGISILNLVAAVEILKYPDDRYAHTFLGSATNQFFLVWFLLNGYGWWKAAAPFVAAYDNSFDEERGLIGQWLADLKYGDRNRDVIEFSVKSFWNGYWTYRLLDLGNCWAVARFKLGNLRGLVEYRVRNPDAISVFEQPNGKLRIEIAGRLIRDADTSAESRNRLLHIREGAKPESSARATNLR